MKIVVIGKGLIGGSLMKAAARAGHDVIAFDKGETPAVSGAEVVFVAVPPSAVIPVIDAIAPDLGSGAIVVDVTGVKECVCRGMAGCAKGRRWTFVGGHPMAGREKAGFANALESLFDGASMILTPDRATPQPVLDRLERLFRELGFARVVTTDPRHHDEMIAYTSQLCHLISSAYVREPLSAEHSGYSAGSFRDMVRVGAPDPDTWTELFFANRDALLPVLDRYLERLAEFRTALADDDRERLHRALEDGVAAKRVIAGENQEPGS